MTKGIPSQSRPLRTDEGEVSDADSEARWAGWPYSAACPHSPRSAKRKRKKRDLSKDPLVYKLTNAINGKAYVGKALQSHRRMWEHENGWRKQKKPQLVDAKIHEYGWHNFRIEWLETNIAEEELDAREKWWIEACGTQVPRGYNVMQSASFDVHRNKDARDAWEKAMPAATAKARETKLLKREKALAGMDPTEATVLRDRLEKSADRMRLKYNGADIADGRKQPNAKRKAAFAAKREAKAASMSPLSAARYLRHLECTRIRKEAQRKANPPSEADRQAMRDYVKQLRKQKEKKTLVLGDAYWSGVPP